MRMVLGVSAALMLTISFTGCCGMHHGCGQNQCCDPCGGGFGGGYGGGYGGGGGCQPACNQCGTGGHFGGGGVYGGGGGWQGQGCCPQQNCCQEWDDDCCEDRCGHGHHRCCLLDFLSIFHMGCGAGCFGGGAACCAPYGYTDPCCNPCGQGFGAGAGPGQGQYAPYMMPTQPIQTLPGGIPGQP